MTKEKHHVYLGNIMGRFLPEPVPEQPRGLIYRFFPKLVEWTASPLVRAWGRTLRLEVRGLRNVRIARRGGGMLLAVWHGNMLVPAYALRDRGLCCMISPVWEGELIARGLTGLGYGAIRASSNYNSAGGLRRSLKALRNGETVVIVLDGPEGPRRVVKQGIIFLASLSGCPIIPIHGTGAKKIVLPSWDRQEFVPPFTRALVRFGQPLLIPRKIKREDLPSWERLVHERMLDLERKVLNELKNGERATGRAPRNAPGRKDVC